MTRWPLIAGVVIVLGLGLCACSSSGDGLMAQANFGSQASDMCDTGGVATGIAALNGSQAAHAQCMQSQYASGQMGYDAESGHFAPGSQPKSLFQSGQ